jgi:hypothetical protein
MTLTPLPSAMIELLGSAALLCRVAMRLGRSEAAR